MLSFIQIIHSSKNTIHVIMLFEKVEKNYFNPTKNITGIRRSRIVTY